ncbi:uncharacterized protein PADG_04595 [Paracoccidioides brasiliensis Pb18]|uniref:Uncharacterized protein n=1 Tax=Paracoccidioides brasiliensis (strain Pb18) TaxID=502780 RepID=C1GC73_PARBD|nr:uncharacterized protein PADG_04595 [Paracoccidioides brasiliensis Pb18]EEH48516.1 hypothetical protein PADG_04595 [Paracoccidioides brasiliensis Pb18]
MSGLNRCLPGSAATRLASGRSAGNGGNVVVASRPRLWMQGSINGSSGRKANMQMRTCGGGYGYGNGNGNGFAFQWRRRLSSDRQRGTRANPNCVTWLTPKPSQVTPSDIILQLPVLPHSQDISYNVPVLLVTPAFASWIVNTKPFFRESMTRIFQNAIQCSSGRGNTLYAVVAVVDKLPSPNTSPRGLHGKGQFENVLVGQQGYEGVSLFIANRDTLAIEVVKPLQKPDMSTPEAEPSLSCLFQLPTNPVSQAARFSEVGIRVANTLFVNGRPRTMVASRWRYSPDPNIPTLILDNEYNLAACRIRCAMEPQAVAMQVPLYPVTKSREIATSMGNIISQVSKGDGSGTTMPASAELEKSLPQYLKENNVQNQRVAVWALIEPTKSKRGHHLADVNGEPIDTLAVINNGARLHRVVSGGGGWGKKQGLLSLDPGYSYQTRDGLVSRQIRTLQGIFEEASSDVGDEDELRMPSLPDGLPGSMQFKDGRFTTDLSEIAKPGDTVQFFISPLDNPRVASMVGASAEGVDLKGTTRVTFGVIPSSDLDWSVTAQMRDAETSSSNGLDDGIVSVPNHFGALSEKSLTYSVFAEGNEEDKGKPGKLILGTNIDVPGSRIVIE